MRKGFIEEAHGGTLFLDEFGRASARLQHVLLTLLERRVVRRLGTNRDLPVDVRVIAASNEDLTARARAGTFAADLLDRFGPFVVTVPPLRVRKEEILLLAERFVAAEAQAMGRPAPPIAQGVLDLFAVAPWPGNVRQLELECAFATLWCGDRCRIEVEDLSPSLLASLGDIHRRAPVGRQPLTARQVYAALELTGGSRTRAAEVLGVDRRQVQRVLKRWGRG